MPDLRIVQQLDQLLDFGRRRSRRSLLCSQRSDEAESKLKDKDDQSEDRAPPTKPKRRTHTSAPRHRAG
ncbi:hypothetical protein AOX55_00005697 (plasmid) [Sinorhizobium fredii CCBAU 25509]|nr:hypothetical protein AOX55_00005697 [Sinorhizobium fredii CCBAU 25509]